MRPRLGLLAAMQAVSMLGTVAQKDAVFGVETKHTPVRDPDVATRIEEATSRAERRRLEKAETKRSARRRPMAAPTTVQALTATPQFDMPKVDMSRGEQPFKNRGRS